jgi:hypothetical protein
VSVGHIHIEESATTFFEVHGCDKDLDVWRSVPLGELFFFGKSTPDILG